MTTYRTYAVYGRGLPFSERLVFQIRRQGSGASQVHHPQDKLVQVRGRIGLCYGIASELLCFLLLRKHSTLSVSFRKMTILLLSSLCAKPNNQTEIRQPSAKTTQELAQ